MYKFGLMVAFVLLSSASVAQNLLTNGAFDTDVSGWSAFSTISWVSDDGASISGNGSMMNMSTFNNNSSFPAISDRFVAQPRYWYLTGVSFKVPTPSPVPWAWYQIYWYDDMNNQIALSNQVTAVFGVPNDVWQDLDGMSQAPEDAAMGELRIYFQSGDSAATELPFGLWDDVFVLEDTVFLNSFD